MSRRAVTAVAPAPAIRPATPDDVETLLALARQVDEDHAAMLPDYFRVPPRGPTRASHDLALAISSPTETVLAALAGDRVAGFVHVQLYDTPSSPTMAPRRRAHIDELVVDRAHRGRGFGGALCDAAAAWARARRAAELVLTVWVGNEAAEGFYRKRGWKPLSSVLRKEL